MSDRFTRTDSRGRTIAQPAPFPMRYREPSSTHFLIDHDGGATVGRPHYRTVETARGPLRVPTLDHPRIAAFVGSLRRREFVSITATGADILISGGMAAVRGVSVVSGYPLFDVRNIWGEDPDTLGTGVVLPLPHCPKRAEQIVASLTGLGLAAQIDSDRVRVDGLTVKGAVARMLFEPNAGGLTLTDALAALGYGHGPGDHNRRRIYRDGEEVAMLAALDVWPWLREQVIERGIVPARLREER